MHTMNQHTEHIHTRAGVEISWSWSDTKSWPDPPHYFGLGLSLITQTLGLDVQLITLNFSLDRHLITHQVWISELLFRLLLSDVFFIVWMFVRLLNFGLVLSVFTPNCALDLGLTTPNLFFWISVLCLVNVDLDLRLGQYRPGTLSPYPQHWSWF